MSDDGQRGSLPPNYNDVVGDNPDNTEQEGFQNPTDDGQQPPPAEGEEPAAPTSAEHINIKVTDGNNEVYFKIKRSTQLKKLMDVFCQRQGKDPRTVRFLFDGQRVAPTDDPSVVSTCEFHLASTDCRSSRWKTEMRSRFTRSKLEALEACHVHDTDDSCRPLMRR